MADSKQPLPPHLLLGLIPYPGEKKDVEKYSDQDRRTVAAYDELMMTEQARLFPNVSTIIHYAALSDNSSSADGTHFQQDTNTILAQMIFNTIAGLSGEEAPYLSQQKGSWNSFQKVQ